MRTAITLLAAVAVLGLTRCAPGGDPRRTRIVCAHRRRRTFPGTCRAARSKTCWPASRRPRLGRVAVSNRHSHPVPQQSRCGSALGRRSTPSPFRSRSPSACPGIRPTRSCSFRKKARSWGLSLRNQFALRHGRLCNPPEAASGQGAVVLFFAGNYPPGERPSHFDSWHMITFGDRSWSFHIRNWVPTTSTSGTDRDCAASGSPTTNWSCSSRSLEMPDLAKTRSLTIAYGGDDNQRRIALNDPRKLSAVLSTIKIVRETRSYPEPEEGPHLRRWPKMGPGGPSVTFSMPKGEVRKMAFVSRRDEPPLAHRRLVERPGRFADPRQRRLLPRDFRFHQEG